MTNFVFILRALLLFPLRGARTRALSSEHKSTKLILQIGCPSNQLIS